MHSFGKSYNKTIISGNEKSAGINLYDGFLLFQKRFKTHRFLKPPASCLRVLNINLSAVYQFKMNLLIFN